jgi:hypothetical protein
MPCAFLISPILKPHDGETTSVRNVSVCLRVYTALNPRTSTLSSQTPRGPQTWHTCASFHSRQTRSQHLIWVLFPYCLQRIITEDKAQGVSQTTELPDSLALSLYARKTSIILREKGA